MPRRTKRYPEGSVTVSCVFAIPVKEGIEQVAVEQRQSFSYVVNSIAETWLRAQGRLPMKSAIEGAA